MKFLVLAMALASGAFAQSAEEAIRGVLTRQTQDWNRGDIRGFMQGYDDSEATVFIGSSVERGYRRVLERFLSRYDTRDKMGQLTFTNVEVHPLGSDYALVIGNFHLARPAAAGGDSNGIFTLTFHKKADGWKIVADHTSEIR